ncbi:unnamed protein product [Urochloa decumbens]|uniref:F-box domain-containing protein n=1 Tax=Urochloa decumbens TaxID=240449 RepID=A0ABC9AQ85_9POAL
MELERAFRKRARASGGGGPDRLSALPDCILHVIMSFMKARQAVQTCVLSKRWRYLWHSVPCLDIDFDEFKKAACASDDGAGSGGKDYYGSDDDVSYTDSDRSDSNLDSSDASDYIDRHRHRHRHRDRGRDRDSDRDKYKDWEAFEDFAVSLMHHRNIAQLDSFRLDIVGSKAPEFGDRWAAGWLRRAMKYCIPDRANQRFGLSSGSWLLKRLHLGHVLLDNRFMKQVRSVCRSLQDLQLDDCSCQIQSITSKSLKTLVLRNCRWRNLSKIISPTLKTLVIDGFLSTDDCVLVIVAPAVAYLHLDVHVEHFSGGISINEVTSLAKASIRLQCHRYELFRSKLCGDQIKLLCSLSTVTSLELSDVRATVLGKKHTFLEFKNLRNLLLGNCDLSDNFHILVFFLQSSPILEKITLRCCEFPKYSYSKKGTAKLNKTPSSELRGLDLLCENLKVEIIYKRGYGPHLLHNLLRISVNLSKNNIKLTKVN